MFDGLVTQEMLKALFALDVLPLENVLLISWIHSSVLHLCARYLFSKTSSLSFQCLCSLVLGFVYMDQPVWSLLTAV